MISDSDKMAQFVKLLTASQSRIYAFILSRVLLSADADDILQETTSMMWKKFDQFQLGTDFLAWGVTIARYNILDYRKKYNKKLIMLDKDVLDRIDSLKFDNSDSDRRMDALRKCIGSLPGNSFRLIQMRYTDGIDVKEISQRLGRSVPGIYKILSKVHITLMRCINRRIHEESI